MIEGEYREDKANVEIRTLSSWSVWKGSWAKLDHVYRLPILASLEVLRVESCKRGPELQVSCLTSQVVQEVEVDDALRIEARQWRR